MSGYTPAPWSVVALPQGDSRWRTSFSVMANNRPIAADVQTGEPTWRYETAEANARLIASAPRFYAAADDLLMTHAAYRSEAGEGMCDCEACALFRPLVEALS